MSPVDLPEPIATAHRRMVGSLQRLTSYEATQLLECATAEFHRAERLEQEVMAANSARYRDAEYDRSNLAEIARLERVNVWLRRQFWSVSIAAVVVIVLLSVALWSTYA
jgi:hypothetical protein